MCPQNKPSLLQWSLTQFPCAFSTTIVVWYIFIFKGSKCAFDARLIILGFRLLLSTTKLYLSSVATVVVVALLVVTPISLMTYLDLIHFIQISFDYFDFPI